MTTITGSPRARRPWRRPTLALLAASSLTLLASCAIPGPAQEPSGAVGFDGVQSATIQLEARGTFVDPQHGGYEAAGHGSGFLISADGLAITNNHVVVGAGTIDVWRGGDTTDSMHARVLGSSECLDLAVVQLDRGGLPHFDWHKGEIQTATDVYAAGFPLGDPTFTMTRGIVSKSSTPGATPWASLDSVIEHDARIRPGNSGGPLVDTDGRVVGVNYAGNNTHDANFAIHRDEVLDVLDQLIAGESVLSLGINAHALMGDDGGLGVWVSSVAAGSAADVAGVEPGDLLTRLQGVTLGTDGTLSEYCDVLRTHGSDATLDIELYRPSDGLFHRGQVNGSAIEAVSIAPGGAAPTGEFVAVSDDSGIVSVEIPASWGDVDGSPYADGRGNTWASITASPDLQKYSTGWSTPGVDLMVSDTAIGNTTTQELLTDLGTSVEGQSCRAEGGAEEFADGLHTGLVQFWTDCGDEGALFLALAARADTGDYLVFLAVQANTEDDLAAVDRVLGSFHAQL